MEFDVTIGSRQGRGRGGASPRAGRSRAGSSRGQRERWPGGVLRAGLRGWWVGLLALSSGSSGRRQAAEQDDREQRVEQAGDPAALGVGVGVALARAGRRQPGRGALLRRPGPARAGADVPSRAAGRLPVPGDLAQPSADPAHADHRPGRNVPGRQLGERDDVRLGDGLAVGGVAEGGAEALARQHAREPDLAVVPHAVERQRRDREPLRPDLVRLGRLGRTRLAVNTSTVMSQAGRAGNRNVMCAASAANRPPPRCPTPP